MTSIRRKISQRVSGSREEPTLSELTSLIEDVGTLFLEGHVKVTVSITGRPEELKDLAEELRTWTPAHGWSKDAQQLFNLLETPYEDID